jgi:uncharacterized protein YnzC (UPF0291/DUF896 family)
MGLFEQTRSFNQILESVSKPQGDMAHLDPFTTLPFMMQVSPTASLDPEGFSDAYAQAINTPSNVQREVLNSKLYLNNAAVTDSLNNKIPSPNFMRDSLAHHKFIQDMWNDPVIGPPLQELNGLENWNVSPEQLEKYLDNSLMSKAAQAAFGENYFSMAWGMGKEFVIGAIPGWFYKRAYTDMYPLMKKEGVDVSYISPEATFYKFLDYMRVIPPEHRMRIKTEMYKTMSPFEYLQFSQLVSDRGAIHDDMLMEGVLGAIDLAPVVGGVTKRLLKAPTTLKVLAEAGPEIIKNIQGITIGAATGNKAAAAALKVDQFSAIGAFLPTSWLNRAINNTHKMSYQIQKAVRVGMSEAYFKTALEKSDFKVTMLSKTERDAVKGKYIENIRDYIHKEIEDIEVVADTPDSFTINYIEKLGEAIEGPWKPAMRESKSETIRYVKSDVGLLGVETFGKVKAIMASPSILFSGSPDLARTPAVIAKQQNRVAYLLDQAVKHANHGMWKKELDRVSEALLQADAGKILDPTTGKEIVEWTDELVFSQLDMLKSDRERAAFMAHRNLWDKGFGALNQLSREELKRGGYMYIPKLRTPMSIGEVLEKEMYGKPFHVIDDIPRKILNEEMPILDLTHDEFFPPVEHVSKAPVPPPPKGESLIPEGFDPKLGMVEDEWRQMMWEKWGMDTQTIKTTEKGEANIIRRMSREDIEDAYNRGYIIMQTRSETGLPYDGKFYRHMLVKKDLLQELPTTVLQYKPNYVSKINKNAYYIVKRVGSRNIDGGEVLTTKTKRIFNNIRDAEEYTNEMKASVRAIKERYAADTTQRGQDMLKRLEHYDYVMHRDGQTPKELADAISINDFGDVGSQGYGRIYSSGRSSEAAIEELPRESAHYAMDRLMTFLGKHTPLDEFKDRLEHKFINDYKSYLRPDDFGRYTINSPLNENVKMGHDELVTFNRTRDQIKYIIGYSTGQDKWMHQRALNVAEFMEKTMYPKLGIDTASKTGKRLEKIRMGTIEFGKKADPIGLIRMSAFYPLIGMFNPAQFIVQGTGAVIAFSLDPLHALDTMRKYSFLRATSFFHLENPNTIKAVEKLAKIHMLNPEESVAMWKRWMRGGTPYNSLSSMQYHATKINNPGATFFTPLKSAIAKNAVFFGEGEFFNAVAGWVNADRNLTKQLGRAPKTAEEFLTLEQNASKIVLDMSRMNHAVWQKGIWSIPTQFRGYFAKYVENLTSAIFNGKSSAWTRGEAMKILAGQLGFFGLAGIPAGTYYRREIANFLGIDQNKVTEQELAFFRGGMVDWAVSWLPGNTTISAANRLSFSGGFEETYNWISGVFLGNPGMASTFKVALGPSVHSLDTLSYMWEDAKYFIYDPIKSIDAVASDEGVQRQFLEHFLNIAASSRNFMRGKAWEQAQAMLDNNKNELFKLKPEDWPVWEGKKFGFSNYKEMDFRLGTKYERDFEANKIKAAQDWQFALEGLINRGVNPFSESGYNFCVLTFKHIADSYDIPKSEDLRSEMYLRGFEFYKKDPKAFALMKKNFESFQFNPKSDPKNLSYWRND